MLDNRVDDMKNLLELKQSNLEDAQVKLQVYQESVKGSEQRYIALEKQTIVMKN